MKTDKNTIIGFVLLGALFFVFFWFTNRQQKVAMAEQQRIKDSIELVEKSKIIPVDPAVAKADSLRVDSLNKLNISGDFAGAANGTEQLTVVENEVMKVTFTNKGGQVKQVQLKNYTSYDKKPVVLGGATGDELTYTINTAQNHVSDVAKLYFSTAPVVKNADGSQTVNFTLANASGQSVIHSFIIRSNDYMIDWNVNMRGADKLLTSNTMNIQWYMSPQRHEGSLDYERQLSNVCFNEEDGFDYISSKTERTFDKKVKWLGAVQQFFNTTLIAKNGFNSGSVKWGRKTDSSSTLSNVVSTFQYKAPASAELSAPFQLYFGPNDYQMLKKAAPEMDKIVNLGRDVYSFVRPINKFIIMPVFNFFASLMSNFGWVILLLTLFIRLVTSPLTYTSYLSGAKMKVLRPELDELKKKLGGDQQAFAMEQMKLFREAGVNPLGGCIPALLQIPIFFALYSFFNSNIALRGQSFLWSNDLSAYDSIVHFSFNVWGLGNHLSLFTITAVLTSFLISIYNMSMTPTQDNPAMKYMPYIFPFVLFFVFNKLPSALTWYYTVSNLITLGLQFVIQHYIIDHNKILAKMDENRKKPKAKSKWQEKYSDMMDQQKKLQDMKNKTKK
ncbi:protein translocase subunit yidC [Filimonas lacunae]|uniref:Membrane protein insertase YidC n=1 Tax=Filimonas lacunae TaxID=477680 RepID=A0A173MM93_9BACT|nr:membrane protein insertase YidC [Filimonas lacunae]BAV08606.1 inner membrane protein translocase component YidC, long form [Filimonas lacunae]SIS58353.1 protein translocase subunit yidC [Filimonas lacunae]